MIRAASYRPFEGGKRVFVLEAAEAMRDESQNALLKTLEEPPGFVHLILLSSEPEALLDTVASRCQPIEFAPLPAAVLEAELAAGTAADGTISADNQPKSSRRPPRRLRRRRGLRRATSSGGGCCSPSRGGRCGPRSSGR